MALLTCPSKLFLVKHQTDSNVIPSLQPQIGFIRDE